MGARVLLESLRREEVRLELIAARPIGFRLCGLHGMLGRAVGFVMLLLRHCSNLLQANDLRACCQNEAAGFGFSSLQLSVCHLTKQVRTSPSPSDLPATLLSADVHVANCASSGA